MSETAPANRAGSKLTLPGCTPILRTPPCLIAPAALGLALAAGAGARRSRRWRPQGRRRARGRARRRRRRTPLRGLRGPSVKSTDSCASAPPSLCYLTDRRVCERTPLTGVPRHARVATKHTVSTRCDGASEYTGHIHRSSVVVRTARVIRASMDYSRQYASSCRRVTASRSSGGSCAARSSWTRRAATATASSPPAAAQRSKGSGRQLRRALEVARVPARVRLAEVAAARTDRVDHVLGELVVAGGHVLQGGAQRRRPCRRRGRTSRARAR